MDCKRGVRCLTVLHSTSTLTVFAKLAVASLELEPKWRPCTCKLLHVLALGSLLALLLCFVHMHACTVRYARSRRNVRAFARTCGARAVHIHASSARFVHVRQHDLK